MLENAIGFMTWSAAVSAVVLGGAAMLLIATIIFMASWKLLTVWANRLAQRLVDIHGLQAVKKVYQDLENARNQQEGKSDEQ